MCKRSVHKAFHNWQQNTVGTSGWSLGFWVSDVANIINQNTETLRVCGDEEL